MSAIPSDQQVRDRIRNDLDTTLVIEAAAGTGKTTALVNRIVSVIESGRGQLSQIVAVTFTEKAAGELKLRLRAEIEQARHGAALDVEVRARLDKALEQLEEARIGTIHSFCADLLRERPVEARVDPMFEVAPEDVASEMFDAAFDRWFEMVLENPGEGMRRLLRRRDLSQRTGPREIARRAAYDLLQWRDFDSPWQPSPFDRDSEIDSLIKEILAFGRLADESSPDDWLGKSLSAIAKPVSEAIRLESVRGRDHDALESVLVSNSRGRHWDWRGFGGDFGEVERGEVFRRREALRERLKKFRETAGANLAPLLRDELWPVVGYYEELKSRAGRLDFLDLLLKARDLVRDNAAVRATLQKRFTHIFVDEFQDTDPLQAEILILLSASDPAESDWRRVRPHPGRLFIVGDPKQSIYRFRRADVALYQGVKQMLLLHGAALEHLTVSFRANPELQHMANAAFAPLMNQESRSQPQYAPLMQYRQQIEGQPAIVALPVPEPYGDYGRVFNWKIDESIPKAIAAFIKWLVDKSGWRVTEREAPDTPVAIRPRHICVLFRRMNSFGQDITRAYLRELEARHLPHVLVKGGSFNEREEVVAIRNVLGAIERPDDELLVFASLHGPLFALSDAALLEFRETIGSLHPFRKIPDGLAPHLKEVKDALDVIRDLHRGRNRRPIAETLAMVLAKTRAHAGIAIWPTGEQALANVMRIMDQARRYEARSGATSFRGFVDELEARADRDEASETPIVEEGTEGVRIMTVHRAKGLEFPIVILADPTCNETRAEASRYAEPASRLCAMELAGCAPRELLDHNAEELERDKREAERLLYVATTRARDLIVVPTVGDVDPFAQTPRPNERDGWLDRLDPVIYPATQNRRPPLMPKHAGCPEFGDDSVLTRPARAPLRNKSVMPGLHRAHDGEHNVVWWDPSRLELQVEEQMGLRQNKLLQVDEKKLVSEQGKQAYEAWRANRAAMLAAGAMPSLKVSTATELAIAAPDAAQKYADAIAIERIAREAGRPHGKEFGTLVHLAMLRTPFDADAAQVARIAAGAGRILGAPENDVAAAAIAVVAALDSSLMRRARVAQTAMRECPLMLTLDDGAAVEGIADLVFAEKIAGAVSWTVVDFKTDAGLGGRLDEYRAQIDLYMRALARSTGCPVRGAILWI
ncbi:MAG: UvrD-helicase domain-containing protein [Candidatus Binatus sp.]|uniref:UvrD-helicase domain-containing protein n=1 Tax=Candidatus Binatus sp. TaxID=2811406 RepID=UPI00271E404F|nr:UvrD-helicase domain-containing protein [Candidatus Binatus sp.]MDO8433262.1 UvrD-helicase domain-containing protein [Candidatus Binatus sp.]